MQVYTDIDESFSYELTTALLLYKHRHGTTNARACLVRHPVTMNQEGKAVLGSGCLVDKNSFQRMVKDLNGSVPKEVLPENVLYRDAESICWWVPSVSRAMFYVKDKSPELESLSGKHFPQPALVLKADGNKLRIRALSEGTRPTADTELCRAPYWNVDDSGHVCLGSTQHPDQTSLASMTHWENSFFESMFSHPNARHRLTEHPQGYVGLWKSVQGRKRFPSKYLASADQTLAQFLMNESRGSQRVDRFGPIPA